MTPNTICGEERPSPARQSSWEFPGPCTVSQRGEVWAGHGTLIGSRSRPEFGLHPEQATATDLSLINYKVKQMSNLLQIRFGGLLEPICVSHLSNNQVQLQVRILSINHDGELWNSRPEECFIDLAPLPSSASVAREISRTLPKLHSLTG